MKSSNLRSLIDLAGYVESRLITASFTNVAGQNGTGVARPGGLLEVGVVGSWVVTAGAGTFNLFLEGSNDGTNWHTISSTGALTIVTGTTFAMNSDTTSTVSVGRFGMLRVRSVVVDGGALAFTASIFVSGIAANGTAFAPLTSGAAGTGAAISLVRSATAMNGTATARLTGSRFCTMQVVMSNVVLGGGSSILCSLQGSPDGGTTWTTIGTVSPTADGSFLVADPGGSNLIDMGPFNTWRVRASDVGGVITSYTARFLPGFDDSDWLLSGESSGSGGTDAIVTNALTRMTFVSQTGGTGGSNAIVVTWQVSDLNGNPIAVARRVEAIVYDTSFAGDVDLSSNATITAVTVGTLVAGTGTNRAAVVSAAATGLLAVTFTDATDETVYCAIVTSRSPHGVPNVVTQCDQVTLTYSA